MTVPDLTPEAIAQLVERLRGQTIQVSGAAFTLSPTVDSVAAASALSALAARVKELEDKRPTFCSHTAVPWNGHHEESCYTRPPSGPAESQG